MRKVEYSLDNGENWEASNAIDDTGSGRDKFTYTINDADDKGSVVTPGKVTVLVRPENEANSKLWKKVRSSVVVAKVDLSALAADEGAGGNDNKIVITAPSPLDVGPIAAGDDASGCAAGEDSFIIGEAGVDATKNDLKITRTTAP